MPLAGERIRAGDAPPTSYTTWSPSYTNITVGNGTVTAEYVQIGPLCHAKFRLVWGGTTSYGSTPEVTLPIAGSGYAQHDVVGVCNFYDSSVGSGSREGGLCLYDSSDRIFFIRASVAGGTIGSTVPFTWASGDILSFSFTYRVA